MKLRNYMILMVALVAVGFSSCKKEDTLKPSSVSAEFTFTKSGMVVTFNNTSSNSSFCNWAFGDNETSFETNPIHTYATAGDYTVTLTASGLLGTKSTKNAVVKVP